MKPSTRRRWRPVLLGFAWVFLLLGIIGLFLPILQGFLFLLVSLYLFGLVTVRGRLLRIRLRRKYPHAAHGLDEAEAWLKRQGRRFRRRPAGGGS
jgi:uncharacterized protein